MAAGQVQLAATGLSTITYHNDVTAAYCLLPGYGPQGEAADVKWVHSWFTHPVPVGAQPREAQFYLPTQVKGSSDTAWGGYEDALIDMVTQRVWTLTFSRNSLSRAYLCSMSDWHYDHELPGFDDLSLPYHVQKLAITVPCVRTA